MTQPEDTPDPKQADATPDFERSLAELEALVQRMEKGDLPLEESLAQFERGIALTRACQQALRQAEQKVEILLGEHGGEGRIGPFREEGRGTSD